MHEDWQDKSSYTLHKWHLERVEVDEMLKVIPKVSEVEGMNGSNRFVTSI